MAFVINCWLLDLFIHVYDISFSLGSKLQSESVECKERRGRATAREQDDDVSEKPKSKRRVICRFNWILRTIRSNQPKLWLWSLLANICSFPLLLTLAFPVIFRQIVSKWIVDVDKEGRCCVSTSMIGGNTSLTATILAKFHSFLCIHSWNSWDNKSCFFLFEKRFRLHSCLRSE